MKRNFSFKKNLKFKKSITRRKNRRRLGKSMKKGGGKKTLSLKKRNIKKGGSNQNNQNQTNKNQSQRRLSRRDSLFESSSLRNGKFFIVYLIKLQEFNNKNALQLRKLCNFDCDNENGFRRILYPDNDDIYGGQGGTDRFKCSNNNENKSLTDLKYFEDHLGGKNYFEVTKYNQIFNNAEFPIGDESWSNLVDFVNTKFDGVGKNIVFGPAELLGPFTKNNQFYGLSHKKWTSNLNFNYIIHMLYKYGKILFVIPKYNNISSEFTNLSSFCNAEGDMVKFKEMIKEKRTKLNELNGGDEKNKLTEEINILERELKLIQSDQFARATFNELILLTFLQDEDLIDLEFVNNNKNNNKLVNSKINCIDNYTDKVPIDGEDIGECYYEILGKYNNTRTKHICTSNSQTFASCGSVETDNSSKLENSVPYKFHIIIVKTKNNENFKNKFSSYNELEQEPEFP